MMADDEHKDEELNPDVADAALDEGTWEDEDTMEDGVTEEETE